MSHKNRKLNAGFTIIEVLIVLAIAGLILLIVFLAVPALQRNSRNTSLKQDVQNVVGGVSEYQGANNGQLPTSVVTDPAAAGKILYTGATATSINTQGSTVVSTVTTVPTTGTGGIQPSEVRVMLKNQCNGNTAVTANTRSIAVFYAVETTSGLALQCAGS